MRLATLEAEMIESRGYFRTFSPNLWSLPIGKFAWYVRTGKTIHVTYQAVKMFRNGTPIAETLGDVLGGRIIKLVRRPVRREVIRTHIRTQQIPKKDLFRINGVGGRGWINTPGRHTMTMVFHDANRAGPHVDVHIGRLSMVYRVKPDLYSQLKYNREGMLTENSRKLLLNHVKAEVANGSRVPQNLDHSITNGRATWIGGDPNAHHYGAGRTRQVFHQSEVDVYKTGYGHPIEFYAPAINPYRGVYIHRLYDGGGKTAPILIWGARRAAPPRLEDRLHLRMADPNDLEKLALKADMKTSTIKYDGSSVYVVITKDGATYWSPRTSVRTGEQIEYTPKLGHAGLASVRTQGGTIVGMGELVFHERSPWYQPWRTGAILSSGAGGGLLNGHDVVPRNIEPELRLYRIDRIGRTSTRDLPFWDNRVLQENVARLHPSIKVVDLASPEEARERGFEGVVVVPEGGSVDDGFKVKWWQDANDWRIDRVGFRHGDRGGIAGVVHVTSLESGREFRLGPSQVGNRELTERMLQNPKDYEGVVLKVQSRHGHEGRAAKVVVIHQDKGFAPG